MARQNLTPMQIGLLTHGLAQVKSAQNELHETTVAVFPTGATLHFAQLRQMRLYEGRVLRVQMDHGTPEIWLRNSRTENSQKFYLFEIFESHRKGELKIDLTTAVTS